VTGPVEPFVMIAAGDDGRLYALDAGGCVWRLAAIEVHGETVDIWEPLTTRRQR